MSIELKASRNYPGRTALEHRTYPESNTTTILDLTPEDVEELRKTLAALEPFDYPYLIEVTPETYVAGTQRVQKLITEFINGGVMAVVTVQPAEVKEG